MSIDTVAVTGGNGYIGEVVLEHLAEHGYEVANLARGKQREDVSDRYLTTDLTDPGEVYGSLAKSGADALIHMGTIPNPLNHPGHVTFESNANSTYHVLEAAQALGIESVAVASSINVLGCAYQDAPTDLRYLPVDEDHPVTPRDPYAIGKHAMEVTCDGFGRREEPPHSIASLRYPWVASDDDLADRFGDGGYPLDEADPDGHHRDHCFSYLHLDDAASIARRAIEAEFEGHEAFWAVAGDTIVDAPTERVADESYPDLDRRREFEGRESLIAIDKARDLLGWEPERSWTDVTE